MRDDRMRRSPDRRKRPPIIQTEPDLEIGSDLAPKSRDDVLESIPERFQAHDSNGKSRN